MAVFRVDAIGAALKELEISGYLVCRQLRDARGRITDTDYTIYEQPHTCTKVLIANELFSIS